MPENWNSLTADQKQDVLFNSWLAPEGAKFASAQAEQDYKARVTRIKDAIQLKKTPDRVPVVPMRLLPAHRPAAISEFFRGFPSIRAEEP